MSTGTAPDRSAPRTCLERGDTLATLVRHHIRTTRISSAVWIVGLVVVAVLVVAVYESAYPTAAERAAQIAGNPSFEALFGPARHIVLVAAGLGVGDAGLVGGGQALVGATFAAAAALAAQLTASRGRTTALAAGALAVADLLRVLATGADLEWLTWTTPLGW